MNIPSGIPKPCKVFSKGGITFNRGPLGKPEEGFINHGSGGCLQVHNRSLGNYSDLDLQYFLQRLQSHIKQWKDGEMMETPRALRFVENGKKIRVW